MEKLLKPFVELVERVLVTLLAYLHGKQSEKLKNEKKFRESVKKRNAARRRLISDRGYWLKLYKKYKRPK